MKLLLQLKNWRIFLISWGPLTAVLIILLEAPEIISRYFPIIFGVFIIGLSISFAWVWTIVSNLKKLAPALKTKFFKIVFWLPFIYIWYIIVFLSFNLFIRKAQPFDIKIEMMIHAALTIISICCILYGLFFIGRLIKSAESGKTATFKEHIFESIAMLFPPIGIWFIQPKLNNIARNKI